MKIPHKKRSMFLPLMFLVSFLLSGVCFLSHSSGTSTLLSRGLSFITTPLTYASTSIYNAFDNIGTYFKNVEKLEQENRHLKARNKSLSEKNAKVVELEKENSILYDFLELKKERTDFDFLNVKIISKTSSNYISTFTIDKGSFHGIKQNMPIISSDGTLLGITYSVEENSTRCMSIISYDTKVGVYDKTSGETGILTGSFSLYTQNKCLMEGIANDSNIKVGDTILTSGLGDIYPRDLIIGTVEGFEPKMGSHTKSAVIKISQSAFNSENVMAITDFERVFQ